MITAEQIDQIEAALAKVRSSNFTGDRSLASLHLKIDQLLRNNAEALLSAARENVKLRAQVIESSGVIKTLYRGDFRERTIEICNEVLDRNDAALSQPADTKGAEG